MRNNCNGRHFLRYYLLVLLNLPFCSSLLSTSSNDVCVCVWLQWCTRSLTFGPEPKTTATRKTTRALTNALVMCMSKANCECDLRAEKSHVHFHCNDIVHNRFSFFLSFCFCFSVRGSFRFVHFFFFGARHIAECEATDAPTEQKKNDERKLQKRAQRSEKQNFCKG